MSDYENYDVDAHYSAMIRTGEWLDGQTFPPLRWAVPGLIPEGFGLLIGPPKAGKSWAALSVSLSVAGGSAALGNVDVGPARPVLYLALEDGDRRLQERCRLLLDDAPIPPGLNYATRATPAECVSMVRWWMQANGSRSPLVVLDTLGKVSPPTAPGESAYARDYRIGGTLKQLVDDHPGSTLLAVHHDRKAASDDFVDSVSGTHGLAGAADFVLVLDRKRQEDDAVLKVTGRDVRESEYAMTLSDSGRWALKGSDLAEAARAAATVKSTAGLGDRSAEIVEYVASRNGPVAPADVVSSLGITEARRYMARLAEQGRLIRKGRGLYTCVPTVPVSQPGGTDNVIRPHQWDSTPHASQPDALESQSELTGWDKGTDGTGGEEE